MRVGWVRQIEGGAGARWILAASLCGVALALFGCRPSARTQGEKDPNVEAEWQPADSPVLSVPGVIEVVYHDLGDKVELTIASNSNPVVTVDVNGDHRMDSGDISYSAGPSDSVCIDKLDPPKAMGCNGVSRATVKTEQREKLRRTIWRIPKQEIAPNRGYADLMIRAFHGETQTGEYYPNAMPFAKVYRVRFAETYVSSDSHTKGAESITPPVSAVKRPEAVSTPEKETRPGAGNATVATPTVAAFQVEPASSDPAAGFRLHWAVSGARRVEILPGIGEVAAVGEVIVTPQVTTRYVLVGTAGASKVTRETTIAVAPPTAPRIAAFSADAAEVQAGATTRLSWDVEGRVSSLRIDPLGTGLSAHGSREIRVDQTGEYVLTAEGPGGTATGKVTVRARPLGPPVISFEAVPAAVRAGDAATLRWNVRGADHISVDSGVGAVSPAGSTIVRPASTAHYTITAAGPGGTATRDVSVAVSRGTGASRGRMVWTGDVHGTQLINIDRDHADIGKLEGALPGTACILELGGDKNVSIASTPGPRNDYERMVLRVKGNGAMRVVIEWVVQ